jgi:hypothetical protein
MSLNEILARYAKKNQLPESIVVELFAVLQQKKYWEPIQQLVPNTSFPAAFLKIVTELMAFENGKFQDQTYSFLQFLTQIEKENPIFFNLSIYWLQSERKQLKYYFELPLDSFQRFMSGLEFAADRYPSFAFGLDEFAYFMRILYLFARHPEFAQNSIQHWLVELPVNPSSLQLTHAYDQLFIKHQISGLLNQHVHQFSITELATFTAFNHGINIGPFLANKLTKKEAFQLVSLKIKPILWWDQPLERSILYIQFRDENATNQHLFNLLNCHSGFRFQLEQFQTDRTFWKPVFRYLQRIDLNIELNQVRMELVNWFDYLQFKKRDNPNFRIKLDKSWTENKIRMEEWIRELLIQKLLEKLPNIHWSSPISFNYESCIDNEKFLFIELTSQKELTQEGYDLHHCVGTFADICKKGLARIFSMRKKEFPLIPIITIELRRNTIFQIKGKHNRAAKSMERKHIEAWKNQFHLH